VALWDQRTSGRYQTTTLTAAARSRALHCLEVVDGGRRVLAGTDAGEIVGWDLRGGRSGGQMFGGGGAYSHPLTLSIPLDAMVRSISGASVQVRLLMRLLCCAGNEAATPRHNPYLFTISIFHSKFALCFSSRQGDTPTFRGPVHSISADPLNERRLGFSLASGTSGVYHSSLQHLTHVFSPASQPAGGGCLRCRGISGASNGQFPRAFRIFSRVANFRMLKPRKLAATAGGGPEIGAMEAYRASVRGKRRGAWWGAGRGFVLESPYTGELLMLDFGPGTSSSSSHGE
jgi:hypothetical protein